MLKTKSARLVGRRTLAQAQKELKNKAKKRAQTALRRAKQKILEKIYELGTHGSCTLENSLKEIENEYEALRTIAETARKAGEGVDVTLSRLVVNQYAALRLTLSRSKATEELARRFSMSERTITNIVRLYEETKTYYVTDT